VTRRALLIASQTYGLRGCDADVALFGEVLAARGFTDVRTLTGTAATRQAILDALGELSASIAPDDAVVVYYSGHGGRVRRPDAQQVRAEGRSPYFQFIVPTDIDASVDGDFRGILSEELTAAQLRLTQAFRGDGRPANVTTILDCCHSAYLARNVEARAKAVDLDARMFPLLGIVRRAEAIRSTAGLATNPDAVRLVACQPEQSAFETLSSRGGHRGVFTDTLATVLTELGDRRVSWAIVADLVRRAVRARSPEQRPDVEGPSDRALFTTEELRAGWAFPVAVDRRGPYVEGAELLGLAAGDELAVTLPGADEPIGTAVVAALVDGRAVLRLDLGGRLLPATASVVPRRCSVPRATVCVDPQLTEVRDAVEASARLRSASVPEEAFATVGAGDDGLVVGDAAGAPWRTGRFADDERGRAAVVALLEELSIGRRLLDLAGGRGTHALADDVAISFTSVLRAGSSELPRHGSRLAVGTRVQVAVLNLGPEPRYFWLFDVGVSGRCTLITASSGTLVGPMGTVDDRRTVWDADGEPLSWPADVPVLAGAARPETFVVVLADRRSDLRGLAGVVRDDGEPPSALDAVLAEVRAGVRAERGAGDDGLRYRLEEIAFLLSP
jgi:Caspase domain